MLPLRVVELATLRTHCSAWEASQQTCVLFCRERADDRDAQSVSQSGVDDCAKQNLRLVANVTPEFLHEDFDLGERHAGPASYLYEHVYCVCQHSSAIH